MNITSIFRIVGGLTLALLAIAAIAATCDGPAPDSITRQNDRARAPSGSASKSVFDLKVGDCVTETFSADQADSTDTAHTLSCGSPLASGMVVDLVKVNRNGSYPGEAYFSDEMLRECDVRADAYFFPTSDSWDAGDRTIVCVETF